LKIAAAEERCSGCRVCQLVCSLTLFRETNPGKAAIRVKGEFPEPGRYWITFCDQCGKCAEVCPVEAITADGGVYRIDRDSCTGCGLCVDTCPKGAMFTLAGEDSPFKCELCGACLEYCPRSAVFDADGGIPIRRW